jgi:hypothetical protein
MDLNLQVVGSQDFNPKNMLGENFTPIKTGWILKNVYRMYPTYQKMEKNLG